MTPGNEGHRYFEELAVSHVVGGLDDTESRIFRAHLLDCGDCRAQVGELRAIAHDLADVERDERRVRAAKAIEVKRRETHEDEPDEDDRPTHPRASRIGAIVGLVLVIVMAAWNFTLRGAVAELSEANRRGIEASWILELGEAWQVLRHDGIDGRVKQLGNRLVILLVNADGQKVYDVFVQDAAGATLWNKRVSGAVQGRFLLGPLELTGSSRVIVTEPGPDAAEARIPSGRPVFEAKATPHLT
jgi:hypothetical protein